MKKNKKKEAKQGSEIEGIDFGDEVKRLNRVIGQIEGIGKMLGDRRKLADVLVQCKAVRSAVKAIESRILEAHVEQVLDQAAKLEKKKSRAEQLAELKDLFKHVQ